MQPIEQPAIKDTWVSHDGSVTILTGDNRETLKSLPDNSVHCIVTSPPYYGLRDYGTAQWEGGDSGCDHFMPPLGGTAKSTLSSVVPDEDGYATGKTQPNKAQYRFVCAKCGAKRIDSQIGLEQSPEEYVSKLVEVFREVRRVLRDDGTLWLNLGDSYAGSGKGSNPDGTPHPSTLLGKQGTNKGTVTGKNMPQNAAAIGLKPKDLIGIPWRVAFALQADGWYLRQDIIWCLSGGTWLYVRTQKGDMPMTVKDLARLDPSTVKLWNGDRWTQLLGTNKSKRKGDELEIVLRSGERISCTPTHKFPTNRGLLEAKDITIGDALTSCKLPEPFTPKDCAIDEDAAWFAGLYIAEGSMAGDTIQISGHAKEIARLVKVEKIAKKYGGTSTATIDGNGMSIRVYGKVLCSILSELVTGKNAHDKGFSSVVWRYSNKFIAAMIDGYLSGDGHEDGNRWRLGFCRNYNLERDLRTACARLGYSLTLNLSTVEYNGKDVPTFRGEIRKTKSQHRNNKDRNEVVAIRKARCRFVYDLGVEDDPHTFALASGILTHNSKPNPMPESVTDRCTKAHEYIFLLSKSARYYYDAEAIKEASLSGFVDERGRDYVDRGDDPRGRKTVCGTNGSRNKRSVWTVTTKPYSEAHFATFPPDLIKPCILAGCPEKVCGKCGAPYVRDVERTPATSTKCPKTDATNQAQGGNGEKKTGTIGMSGGGRIDGHTVTLGFSPSCDCQAEPSHGVTLDPFGGSGTTAYVSLKAGRNAVLCELNPEYVELTKKRIQAELAQGKLF
jgi:DNA modification methylase